MGQFSLTMPFGRKSAAAWHPTVGLEEEFFICRADDRSAVVPLDGDFLAKLRDAIRTRYPPRSKRAFHNVQPEAFACQVELASGVHGEIECVIADFLAMRGALQQAFLDRGLDILPLGTHPDADWADAGPPHAGRMPYLLSFAGQRMLTCGFHVHVGMPGARHRFAFFQFVRPFLPLLLALGSASPQWRRLTAGSRNCRISVFGAVRHGGVPPLMDAREFDSFRQSIRKAPVIQNEIDQPSWFVRPSIYWPTVEVRVMDANPDVERNLDIAALIQALAAFSRRRIRIAGRPARRRPASGLWPWARLPFVTVREPEWLITDNIWRVEKDGMEAGLLFCRDGRASPRIGVVPVAEFGARWLERLRGDFAALGTIERHRRLLQALGSA
ncbi:MAG TPA: glutamate-cysteine ligase family protein [Rhizomicrobium sp.]|nr:glutamate-cysteine ligase family protein [Rhizomicrobium sp.]